VKEYPVPYHFHSERRPRSTARGNQQDAFLEAIKPNCYSANNQVRLCGEVLDLVSGPVGVSETLVFVDALNRRSGQVRRVRIPPTIVQMAKIKRLAA
jgi:hypothetical protein